MEGREEEDREVGEPTVSAADPNLSEPWSEGGYESFPRKGFKKWTQLFPCGNLFANIPGIERARQ